MLIEETLNKFAKEVIKQSRANLTRSDKNVSRQLYNSLGYNVNVSKNSFSLSILMSDYGDFQDKGVKGADPSKVSPNARIRGQQAPNSKYKFGSGNYVGTWSVFVSSLEKWVKKRGLRLRNEDGTFAKGSARTIAHITAKNIYARGIKPSLFFTKPFESNFKKLPTELIESYGLEVQDLLKFTRS